MRSKAIQLEAPPAEEPPGTPAGDLPRMPGSAGAQNSSGRKTRKKLPRTFSRKRKPVLDRFLTMPEPSGEHLLHLRRESLAFSRADVSRLLRVARNTVWDWESGYRDPPFSAFLSLWMLADVCRHASEWPLELPDARNAGAAQPASHVTSLAVAPPSMSSMVQLSQRRARIGWRGRARDLRERMSRFSSIYNAAWLVRDSWHGSELRKQEYVWKFVQALVAELQRGEDLEALIYAVADSLSCASSGVPWQD